MTDQRRLGVDLFNETWRLMESREDDDLMLDCAHASSYHWALAPECRPENRVRAAWLISRAYTVAGLSEPALRHAERCFQLCERYALGDWDLAFAYEALARASATAGDSMGVERYAELARAVPIKDADDRAQLEGDLATI